MNQTKKQFDTLTQELVTRYGIEPDEVIYYPGDPKPHLRYEAACILANALVPDLTGIVIEPVESVQDDSISLLCSLRLANPDRMRNAVGVANRGEPLDGGEAMSDQQLYQLASSRAMRAALRVAGIDLIKLHYGSAEPVKDNRTALIAQAHALGDEIGYIGPGDDKTLWRLVLRNRYRGTDSCSGLTDSQLADLVAFLQWIKQADGKNAAA